MRLYTRVRLFAETVRPAGLCQIQLFFSLILSFALINLTYQYNWFILYVQYVRSAAVLGSETAKIDRQADRQIDNQAGSTLV